MAIVSGTRRIWNGIVSWHLDSIDIVKSVGHCYGATAYIDRCQYVVSVQPNGPGVFTTALRIMEQEPCCGVIKNPDLPGMN